MISDYKNDPEPYWMLSTYIIALITIITICFIFVANLTVGQIIMLILTVPIAITLILLAVYGALFKLIRFIISLFEE